MPKTIDGSMKTKNRPDNQPKTSDDDDDDYIERDVLRCKECHTRLVCDDSYKSGLCKGCKPETIKKTQFVDKVFMYLNESQRMTINAEAKRQDTFPMTVLKRILFGKNIEPHTRTISKQLTICQGSVSISLTADESYQLEHVANMMEVSKGGLMKKIILEQIERINNE